MRLRSEIELIDQQLNQHYLGDATSFNLEINLLWRKRVNAAKNLKSIYESEQLLARI